MVILVTGSTYGIGRSIADKFVNNGDIVIYNSNQDFDGTLPENAYFIKADISRERDVKEMIEYISNKFGKLDYCVANAGIMPVPSGIDDITENNLNNTIDTNLKGTFWTVKYAGDLINNTSNKGAIVVMSSVDGIIGEPYGVIYSATKAGIISLMKSFARHFPNVRVNAVAPGLIDTPLTNSTGEKPEDTTNLSVIKRMGTTTEIADAVEFLLSESASFITGQTLVVDGGFTLK